MQQKKEIHPSMQRVYEASGFSKPSQLATALNIAPSVVSNWQNRGVSSDGAILMGVAFKVSSNWIMTGEEDSIRARIISNMSQAITTSDLSDDEVENKVWLGSYDIHFSCGEGESIEFHFEELRKKALSFEPDFFVRRHRKPENVKLVYVRGDSMEPYLYDGDMAAIDVTDTTIRDGERYAVYFEGEALIKEIFKEEGGSLRLHSLNPRHKDKYVTEINGEGFKVIGNQFYRSG